MTRREWRRIFSRAPRSIEEVVDAHLCCGCGACAYLEPDRLTMSDVPSVGMRPLPIVAVNGAATTGAALDACPGRGLDRERGALDGAPENGEWGPIMEAYECWATDAEIRYRGSSGGVVSALAAHALASGGAVAVLQTRASSDDPLRNEPVLSRSRDDVLAAAGSRYAPASPCAGLGLVEAADGPCVVVGKPCDIAATRAAALARPRLAAGVGLTVGIFCAGVPSRSATERVIRRLGVDPGEVTRVDYRGDGWPGLFRVRARDGATAATTYADAWRELSRSRQWRCMICPDHSGQFADVSVGDPWYREPQPGEAGRSLLLVRTERGRSAVQAALRDGALEGERIDPALVTRSQPSLQATQRSVWGRVAAMQIAGLRAPSYQGLGVFAAWGRLGWRARAASIAGTLRRIRARNLRAPER